MVHEAPDELEPRSAPRRIERTAPVRPGSVSIPSLLDGLARIHPLLFASDEDGRIVWTSEALGREAATIGTWIGRTAEELETSLQTKLEQGFHRLELEEDGSGRPLTIHLAGRPETASETEAARSDPAGDATLERRNEELESCIHGIAHDLRSPLVSILGFARLLRDDERNPLDATGLHFVDRIEEAGRNIERLLGDIIELHRPESRPGRSSRVDPGPVLRQVATELKLRLDQQGIELVLPEAPPTIHCDRTRLYQIFSNLIGNAIHHMGDTRDPRIDVSVVSTADGWQLEVADNGRGIDEAERPRIFDPFRSARGPQGRPRSSGLGLPIVKKIVDRYGGRIEVESEPGRGARFVVWLPRS